MEETSPRWGFTLHGGQSGRMQASEWARLGLLFFSSGEDGTGPRGLEVLDRYLSQREPWKAGIST